MDEPELPEIGGRSSFLGWNATTSTCSRVVTPDNGGARRTFKDIQPRAINFQMLCMENYPDREWDDLAFRQKVDLVREALKPKHWLIEPHCRPMKRWDILLAIALAFVGIVTPYEVVFIAGVDWALFAVNRAIDVIFTTDICLQFFLEVEIQRPHRGGVVMLRDPRVVRMRYLKSWFLLDLASVLPFDVLSMLLASYSSVWQQAKVLHGLRMLRLVKLLRMLRTLRIHHRWKDAIALPFCTQKLIRFCVILVLLSHWIACVWGLTGLTFGAGLCSEQGQLIHFGEAGVDAGKTSWVTTHFLSSAAPEAACNHFDVYVASLYWAVMTLTSIGYGDIVPVRLEEYVVGIGCMLAGGVLWAYAIGSVCSIISNSSPVERNFEAKADLLNLALDEAHVPHHERHKYREYLREAKAYDRRVSFGQLAKSFSPKLRKHLMYHVTQDALKSVPYFNNPETPPKLLMHLAACLVPKFFSRLESLESLRHCLCMMDRGTVAHGGRILVHPSVFHEDFVIARKMYRKVTRTISLTYTQVLVLTRDDVEEVLESHPHFARTIRVYAFKTAFCRAVHMAMLAHKALRASSAASGQVELSLTQAFDKVLEGGGFPLPVVPRIHSEPSECHGELSMRQL